jgi:hypothetical protein
MGLSSQKRSSLVKPRSFPANSTRLRPPAHTTAPAEPAPFLSCRARGVGCSSRGATRNKPTQLPRFRLRSFPRTLFPVSPVVIHVLLLSSPHPAKKYLLPGSCGSGREQVVEERPIEPSPGEAVVAPRLFRWGTNRRTRAGDDFRHEVQHGDTLSSIARCYGVTVDQLLEVTI